MWSKCESPSRKWEEDQRKMKVVEYKSHMRGLERRESGSGR